MKSTFLPTICCLKRSTLKRPSSLFLSAIAALIFLCLAAKPAFAHHPIVQTAGTVCNADGSVNITFTVTSWAVDGPGLEGENAEVDVLFNEFDSPPAFTGSFVDPTDTFSGSAPAPGGLAPGDMVTVSALADATWGDGYPGGENSDSDAASQVVTIPTCPGPPPPSGTGRFTGGGQQQDVILPLPSGTDTVTLSKGFEVDCDMNPKHENIELNWDPNNHFHMDTITSAFCDLVPPPPNPPHAPVNRIQGTGTGDFNGAEGYTVVFTLIDHGEPGAGVDESAFVVCLTDPANPNKCAIPANIVLNAPLTFILHGNIQAHVDQH
jgi:hypothetical protein